MRGYLSVQETAEKWDVSVRWVNQYILNGRIKPTKQKSGPKPQKTSNKNL